MIEIQNYCFLKCQEKNWLKKAIIEAEIYLWFYFANRAMANASISFSVVLFSSA